MPSGATAQNDALGHLILGLLHVFSLRDCRLHDDRRSYCIHLGPIRLQFYFMKLTDCLDLGERYLRRDVC